MSEPQVIIPRFQVLRRGEVIRVVPVHRSRLVIGSEDGAHLRLKHPAIAPRHLEVTVVDGRYLEAANLAGEGRVLLGNQPMNRARLREGDELDLGPVALRLTYERSESSRSEAPPARPPEVEDEPTIEEPVPTSGFAELEDLREDEATIAGGLPPLEEEPMLPATGAASAAAAGLGPRSRAPRKPPPEPAQRPFSAADSTGVDLDLDEIVLDPTPVVVIEPPGGRPQRVPLRVGSFVVGAGRCAFRLSYPGVAPAHAEMMVMPDGAVYLKHLAGSGLLTLRNGAPVQFSRWNSGDRLQVGPVAMRLQMVSRSTAVESIPTRVGRSSALPREPARPEEVSPPPPPTRPVIEVSAPVAPPPHAPVVEAPAPVEAAPVVEPPPAIAPPPADEPPPIPPPSSPLPAMIPTPVAAPPPAVSEPPQTAEPPPPAEPPARSLVHVHATSKAKAPKKKKLARTSSPLVTTNTVQVQLDVSSRDTFAAILDDEILEYRRPLARRAMAPIIIVLLLLIVLWQAALQLGWLEDDPDGALPPRTASGESGLPGSAASGSTAVGLGPVTIGSPEEILERRRQLAAEGRAGGSGDDPGNIDWEDASRRSFGSTRSFDTDHSSAGVLSGARVADDIERDKQAGAPGAARSAGSQGFVEMADVERAIYRGNRKLRYCYTQARLDDSTLQGIMWLTLTLSNDGRIRGVVQEPRSSLKSEPLRACLERHLYSLEMPLPEGGSVTFSYPFEFMPSE